MKNVAYKHVFKHPEVETLELKGYAALKGLLDHYMPLLEISNKEFEKLIEGKKVEDPIAERVFHRLPNKHVSAYVKAIDLLKEQKMRGLEFKLYEWYYRARLLIDCISGMTDEYTIKEYQVLSAI